MSDPEEKQQQPHFWHSARMRVPLFEVDVGQAVYHGNYFHLFELGRESFFREMGFPYKGFMDREMHLTIVEAHCRYRKSLHYDEEIEVRTGLAWKRSRSLGIMQVILREEGAEEPVLCTEVSLSMVCVRFSGKPTVLPSEFVSLLEKRHTERAQ
jgi:acyl-CoA thioester hydrolase